MCQQIQTDLTGCDIDRVTLSDHTQDYKIVLARKEVMKIFIVKFLVSLQAIFQAVYFYTPHERAQCFAFEGLYIFSSDGEYDWCVFQGRKYLHDGTEVI